MACKQCSLWLPGAVELQAVSLLRGLVRLTGRLSCILLQCAVFNGSDGVVFGGGGRCVFAAGQGENRARNAGLFMTARRQYTRYFKYCAWHRPAGRIPCSTSFAVVTSL